MAYAPFRGGCGRFSSFLLLLLGMMHFALAQDGSHLNANDETKNTPQSASPLSAMSSDAMGAILEDGQIRRAYMALVSMFSDTSRKAAGRYGVSELTMLSNDLDAHVRNMNAKTDESYRLDLKRGIADKSEDEDEDVEKLEKRAGLLGELLPGLGDGRLDKRTASDEADGGTSSTKALGDGGFLGGLVGNLVGGGKGGQEGGQGAGGGGGGGDGGPIGGLISNVAGNLVGKFLNGTGSDLAGAGFFGGIGAGEGAAQALNLTTAANSKTTGLQVAQENGMTNSGLNPIVQNAAIGLTATTVKAAMNNNLLKLPPIGVLATSLGTGLGNGGAMGLGLTKKDLQPSLNGSSVDDIVGGLGFGLSRAFLANLNLTGGMTSLLPSIDFGAAAKGVGTGIGSGAALGLKLTNNTAIEPPPPASQSDIPGIAGTFAFGLARSLTDSVDPKSIGNLVPGDLDIGGAALSVGTGLGGGAAKGLKLVSQDKNLAPPPPRSASDISGIAGTLAFGLSNSFMDGINISAQSLGSMLPPFDLGATALNVGAGLGSGSAKGLGLAAKSIAPPPPPGSLQDIPQIAGTFAFGLGDALTGNLNLTDVTKKITDGAGNLITGGIDGVLSKFGTPLASGLGRGLGRGSAVGLGLQPETAPEQQRSAPQGEVDVGGLGESFGEGLSSRFLANDTIGKALKALSGGKDGAEGLKALLGKIDIPRVANGLTRGLVAGAGDGVQAIGGINAVINGTSRAPDAPVTDTKVEFDDTVGGAAVGFGQGLGSSGVVTLQKLLARGIDLTPVLGSGSGPGKTRRDVGDVSTKSLALVGRQLRRQADPLRLDLSRFIDADAISVLAQKGIDVLTCDGIAGLFLIAIGLQRSGTVSLDLTDNTRDAIKGLIPKGIIRVQSQEHKFEIDGKVLGDNFGGSLLGMAGAITINGSPFGRFAAFLVLHIGGAILGLYIALPLVLTSTSLHNMVVRLRIPHVLPSWTSKASRILMLFVVAPSLLFILIFGLVAGSASGHLKTAHGVLGIIVLIIAIASVVLYFFAEQAELSPGEPLSGAVKMDYVTLASNASNQLLLILLVPTLITGFADLNSITLCLTRAVLPFELVVALGFMLAFIFLLGQYTSAAELILIFMANRKASKARSNPAAEKIIRRIDTPES